MKIHMMRFEMGEEEDRDAMIKALENLSSHFIFEIANGVEVYGEKTRTFSVIRWWRIPA